MGTVQSGLEEDLDRAVAEGEFEEATRLSDRLAQRELASKVATAFDCHHYVEKTKVSRVLLW